MNILFTCAGRRNYLINYFSEALGDKGIIVAVDMDQSAPAMTAADKSYIVPAVYDANYIESIFDICIKEKIRAVISLNDLELPLMATARGRFQKAGIILILSSEDVIDLCFDKWKTYKFAKTYNIKVPNTYLTLEDAKIAICKNELTFPLVVKPRWGSASIGLEFPQDVEELDLAYRLLKIRLSRTILAEASKGDADQAILIQEKINGKEYGIDVFNDFECKPVQVFVKEKMAMRAGETDKAILRNNSDLEAIGYNIGASLGHLGNLDCDVFERDGQYYLLEMNPRFGGGYPFSQMSGARFPDAIIAWLEGKNFDFGKTKKTYDVIYAKCDILINVSGDQKDKSDTDKSNKSLYKGSSEIIDSNDAVKWNNIVNTSYQFDFYHSLEYHLIAEDMGKGKPILFVYQDGQHRIALPLLLSSIHDEEWSSQTNMEMFDATSVYGYTGPISLQRDIPVEAIEYFSVSLINTLRDLHVVSLFSRLHPIIAFELSFDIFFRRRIIGETVSIDLTIPSEAQVSQFSENHKRGIKKLRNGDFTCFEDVDLRYMNDFIDIYIETMDRVCADKYYYFPRKYFSALFENLHGTIHLFVCLNNNEVACAGIFSLCGNIIQYHLGGTRNIYMKYSPMKLLFDVVREWGIKNKAQTFHLGGGLGSSRDSLLQFKAGFSHRRHIFAALEKILLPEEYRLLCDLKADYNRKNNLKYDNESFFPLYRSSVKKIPQ